MVTIEAIDEDRDDLKLKGNRLFGSGNFKEAVDVYSEALENTSESVLRSNLLYNRASAYFKLKLFTECVKNCDEALALNDQYEKALFRRAVAKEELGRLEEALVDLERLAEITHGTDTLNREVVKRIKHKQELQLEKDKAEMMNNLKSLGNSILGNFGMSLDDFKFEKNGETGNYAVTMQSRDS